jgi:hypothetical protein
MGRGTDVVSAFGRRPDCATDFGLALGRSPILGPARCGVGGDAKRVSLPADCAGPARAAFADPHLQTRRPPPCLLWGCGLSSQRRFP